MGPVEHEPFRIGFMAGPETWVGDVVSPLPSEDWDFAADGAADQALFDGTPSGFSSWIRSTRQIDN